jgi:yecA family protein
VATSAITYTELADALSGARLGISPSDLHGSLAGYLCGGGSAGPLNWLDALELAADVDDAARGTAKAVSPALLERMYHECADWLADPELGFEPLLPSAETSLDERADAIVEWCRGFLGGLGLAGAGHQNSLSAEAKEILGDFATIAATRFEYSDREEDENALTEVTEFIRVGALLLHAELHANPNSGATVH